MSWSTPSQALGSRTCLRRPPFPTLPPVPGALREPLEPSLFSSQAEVSAVSFVDNDLDALEISGRVSWTPPTDVSQVTGYRVYLCEGALCGSRAQLGSHVAMGTNQVTFSSLSLSATQTHIGVYTRSSLAEQSTPVTLVLQDEQLSAARQAKRQHIFLILCVLSIGNSIRKRHFNHFLQSSLLLNSFEC